MRFMAPEILSGQAKPSPASDMYAFGLLMLNTVCELGPADTYPLKDVSRVVDPDLKDVISRLLSDNPALRPSAVQLQAEPYFADDGVAEVTRRLRDAQQAVTQAQEQVAEAKSDAETMLAEQAQQAAVTRAAEAARLKQEADARAEVARQLQDAQHAVAQAQARVAQAKSDAERRLAEQSQQAAVARAVDAARLKQEADARVQEARDKEQREVTQREAEASLAQGVRWLCEGTPYSVDNARALEQAFQRLRMFPADGSRAASAQVRVRHVVYSVNVCVDGLGMMQCRPETGRKRPVRREQSIIPIPNHWFRDSQALAVPLRDALQVARLHAALETADPTQLGVGTDVTSWPKLRRDGSRRLKLSAAWRVQNRELHGLYAGALSKVGRDIARGPALTQVCLRRDLVEATSGLPGAVQQRELNESWLLTGVPPDTVLTVLQNGLNTGYSGANAGTLFGEGIYLAEDAAKCDQYVRSADRAWKPADEPALHPLHDILYETAGEHPGDVHYLFLCRVVLGYTLRTRRERTFCKVCKEGPCRKPGNAPHTRGVALDDGATDDGSVFATKRCKELKPLAQVDGAAPIQHHSLLVETCENGPVGSGRPVCTGRGCTTGKIHRYREIVIFHGEQIYP